MNSSDDCKNNILSILIFILVMVIYAFIGTNLLKTYENSDPIKHNKS